jgi:hypothetical protein
MNLMFFAIECSSVFKKRFDFLPVILIFYNMIISRVEKLMGGFVKIKNRKYDNGKRSRSSKMV